MVARRGVGADVVTVRLDRTALMGQQDPLREGEVLEVMARLSRTGDVRAGPDAVEAVSRSVTLAGQPVAVQLSFGGAPGTASVVATAPSAGPAQLRIEVAATGDLQADADTRVFVIVRPLDGPPMPVAVRALTFAELPAVIELTDADAMQPGRTLSRFEEVAVLARLSKSGSPTHRPGDVESEIVQVRPLDHPEVSLLLK